MKASFSIHPSRLCKPGRRAAYSMLYTQYRRANAIRPTKYFWFGSTRIPYSPLNAVASQNARSNQVGLWATLAAYNPTLAAQMQKRETTTSLTNKFAMIRKGRRLASLKTSRFSTCSYSVERYAASGRKARTFAMATSSRYSGTSEFLTYDRP